MDFNLKKAKIFQAVKLALIFRIIAFLKKVFLILFIIAFLLFLYGFILEVFSFRINQILLGTVIISLTLFISCWLKQFFFNSKLKNPKIEITIEQALSEPGKHNLAEFLSFETAISVWNAMPRFNSTALFYKLICDNPELNFIFARAMIDLVWLKKLLKDYLKGLECVSCQDFQYIILESLKVAKKRHHKKGNESKASSFPLRFACVIETEDVIVALAKHDLIFKKVLIDSGLKIEDIESLAIWLESLKTKIEKEKRWWDYQNLIRVGSLAKNWAAGYTLTLDRYSVDWTEIIRKRGFPEIIGLNEEIQQVERILARQEYNNVLVVGEAGTGRRGIVQGLVKKTALGQSLPEINHKRMVGLDIPALLAEISSQEKVTALLDKIFQEVITAGNTVLILNEFHNFIGIKPGPGKIDISGVLASYLHNPRFKIIAVTTYDGFHKNIEQNPAILNLFEKVDVSEVSQRETLMILENLSLRLEHKYKKFVSYTALRAIIDFCDRYIPAIPFPKKAIDLLDEVMVYTSSTKNKIVLAEYVAKIVSEKTEIPVGKIEAKEKELLLNLENLIHQRIINQKEAVGEVSTALRRARAEVTVKKGPIGTFLFLGPTGVGKTETAKALAEIYFGAEEKMIRLDMSEFQDIKDISRLIGSVGEEGLLTTPIRKTPFSLILLDEIEKAHPNILNLFLQVLDEGRLTDGLGRKIDFKNAIIIATSNAGYQIILEALKQKANWSGVKQKLLDYLFEKAIFRPEFINRFDAMVVFKPLSKENLLEIAELIFQKLKKNLKEKNIEFIITQQLKEKIVELGYNPFFGARELKRVIQDKVENILAPALLSGRLKRGDRVEIIPKQDKFDLRIL